MAFGPCIFPLLCRTLLGMRFQVGDVVWWTIPTPQVENPYGPRYQGKFGPEQRGVGEIIELLEEQNAYLIKSFNSGEQGEVLEEFIGGKTAVAK